LERHLLAWAEKGICHALFCGSQLLNPIRSLFLAMAAAMLTTKSGSAPDQDRRAAAQE
jgi:hypothetical protein